MLEQAGGLHGDIRWFNIMLGVFLIFCNCRWILLSYFCMIILTFFSILVNVLYCDIDDWYCGGLLKWSKWVACIVL